MSGSLEDAELADLRAGRDAVYQLAALKIGALFLTFPTGVLTGQHPSGASNAFGCGSSAGPSPSQAGPSA